MTSTARSSLLLVAALLGAVTFMSGPAKADTPGGVNVGIGLVDVPPEADQRESAFIVEHVPPGASFSRRLVVSNDGGQPIEVRTYVVDADIDDGHLAFLDGIEGELTRWVTLDRDVSVIPAGGEVLLSASFSIDSDAAPGEYIGVVFAEIVASEDGTTRTVGRVGTRIYLSVGAGGAPAANFSVDDVVAGRASDGGAYVDVGVTNTGGRAVDVNGTLELLNGPGGLRLGPVTNTTLVSLRPGERNTVRFVLSADVPRGPWEARAELRSGRIERVATATITFPEAAGAEADPVPAEIVQQRRLLIPIALALILALLVALYAAWRAQKAAREKTLEPVG